MTRQARLKVHRSWQNGLNYRIQSPINLKSDILPCFQSEIRNLKSQIEQTYTIMFQQFPTISQPVAIMNLELVSLLLVVFGGVDQVADFRKAFF